MPELFTPKAPNIIGMAKTLADLRQQRENQEVQQQKLGFDRAKFMIEQQRKQEEDIAKQKQRLFDRAAALLKNAPNDEIAMKAANAIGDMLGLQLNTEKFLQNRKAVQTGITGITKLLSEGKKDQALDLIHALKAQYYDTKGIEDVTGFEKGILIQMEEERQKKKVGGIFGGIQDLSKEVGPVASELLKQGEVGMASKFVKKPAKLSFQRVGVGGGKMQMFAFDPYTGEKKLAIGEEFSQFKPTVSGAAKGKKELYAKIVNVEGIEVPQLEGMEVDLVNGKVPKDKAKELKEQGFQPYKVVATNLKAQLGITQDDFISFLSSMTTTAGGEKMGGVEGEDVTKDPRFTKFYNDLIRANPEKMIDLDTAIESYLTVKKKKGK